MPPPGNPRARAGGAARPSDWGDGFSSACWASGSWCWPSRIQAWPSGSCSTSFPGGGAAAVGGAAVPEGAVAPAAAEPRGHGERRRVPMVGMSRRSLRKCIDQAQVVAAIRAAEQVTSGEIRVSVAPFFWGDVEKTAGKAFRRLGMANTADRNGVLIFLVPSRKRFAILGDVGIHEKVGQAFWEEASACLSAQFRQGAFTEGLVEVIQLVGERLATHFPYAGTADRNELPEDVDFH